MKNQNDREYLKVALALIDRAGRNVAHAGTVQAKKAAPDCQLLAFVDGVMSHIGQGVLDLYEGEMSIWEKRGPSREHLMTIVRCDWEAPVLSLLWRQEKRVGCPVLAQSVVVSMVESPNVVALFNEEYQKQTDIAHFKLPHAKAKESGVGYTFNYKDMEMPINDVLTHATRALPPTRHCALARLGLAD